MFLKNIILGAELEVLRKKLNNKKVILGTGCFDILHIGHLSFLRRARSYGDILVIGINSDEAVRKIKGLTRPIIKENERAAVVATLRDVDYVFIYDNIVADESILKLRPDIFVIGEPSVETYPNEISVANNVGANVQIIKHILSESTTSIINKARGS